MTRTVGMVSLGCAKNQVDAEVMLGTLHQHGYSITNNPSDADIIIVNTCGFIDSAKEESVNAILEHITYKTHGKCKTLIVAGCLAERYSQELKSEIPEIDAIVGTSNYHLINEVLKDIKYKENRFYVGSADIEPADYSLRIISTGKSTAYLKIAEGCDNCCTFCIIPKLRGPYKSRRIEGLIKETEMLVSQGIKELIVVAQDISRYGEDLDEGYNLTDLLKELCRFKEIEMIRLLYLYPERITDELINLIASEEKICHYMDIPIQHINSRVLNDMNRATSPTSIINTLNKIKATIPDIVLRTSLIVGFPGETEDEYNELVDFVKKGYFNHVGVFTYSAEEDTLAAVFDNQISDDVKLERQKKIMTIQNNISKRKNRERIGNTYKVLVEGKEPNGSYYGRSYAEAPDVDGLIYVMTDNDLIVGDIVNVKITNVFDYDLVGDIL